MSPRTLLRQPGRLRTVSGPTDHVVVVGAGLAGLSATLRLVAAGRRVTVVERAPGPGGRAGLLTRTTSEGTYRFDTGPTVLTMPDLIEDCLAAVGESLTDWLDLRPVSPLYRARYADGSSLDVHADTDRMAAEIERVIGGAEAAGFRRYVQFVSALYRHEMRTFIDRNTDSPLDLLTGDLARLVALGAFRRLSTKVGQYLHDPRTQRLYSFQSMYAGMSPYRALAVYAVISYMDSVAGVYFPRGGLHAVPVALAGAAERHGARFRYGTTVSRIELRGRRAVAVHTENGERIAADAVVLTPDLPVAWRDLLGRTPPQVRRLRYSPSCFLLLAGSRQHFPQLAHHTIDFGQAWGEVFDELAAGRPMSDPSFLVTTPTRSDPDLAPPGRAIYSVLFPTPHLAPRRGGHPLDWSRIAPAYREHVLRTLEDRGYPGFAEGIETEHVTTPHDWAASGLAAGTPFAAAHTLTQTGPFRPGNLWGENVVFAGSGTRPGVGVPMVLVSGRLAAERILGPTRSG